ncbi:MAG: hypothetical protein AB7V48_08130 [Sedimentibacter sp.]
MTKISIKNLEYFEILDEVTSKKYYGCNQEWYKKPWQRMAGCGPTVATNIILYSRKNIGISKNESLMIMNEMWEHVTPTIKGVNSTNIFYDGLVSYSKSKNKKLCYDAVDVPKKKKMRPSFEKVVDFIKFSLKNDIPLAFLNLCNGEEVCLDKWHWVTLVSLEYEEDLSGAVIEILDEGIKKNIDLLLWYNTTTLGGGFISFNIV